jgi:hypothetical protein
MLQSTPVQQFEAAPNALLRLGTRIGSWPIAVFVVFSLAFGSIIIFVNPPLRGPDEISHFLRIHSYARGHLLPPAEVDDRRGIFVERKLYNQLYFFKEAGERFAKFLQSDKEEWSKRAREDGIRYGPIIAEYSDITG